jgi:hypothetical protein
MSVRLPVQLRDAARSAADASGVTLTDFVARALTAEIVRCSDPAAQFSERIAAAVVRRVAEALDDGSWDEAVSDYSAGDPELTS